VGWAVNLDVSGLKGHPAPSHLVDIPVSWTADNVAYRLTSTTGRVQTVEASLTLGSAPGSPHSSVIECGGMDTHVVAYRVTIRGWGWVR
jgi:hypothetical protein